MTHNINSKSGPSKILELGCKKCDIANGVILLLCIVIKAFLHGIIPCFSTVIANIC